MNCVILQPSYIPWRGYFHQIYKADLFIFFDDVQFDKNGWRNRNRIKTPNGTIWLTIPVLHKGNAAGQSIIKDVMIDYTKDWCRKHWMSIQQAYSKAPYFRRYCEILDDFIHRQYEYLSDFNIDLTVELSRQLGAHHTQFIRSSGLNQSGEKTDRLINILTSVGATHYITGPSARDYLEEEKFAACGIGLEYMVYDYREYNQLYPPYDPQVSILDLLFMVGEKAGNFIWDTD